MQTTISHIYILTLVFCPALFILKYLMTSPKENGEFCFPETINVPRGEAKTLFAWRQFVIQICCSFKVHDLHTRIVPREFNAFLSMTSGKFPSNRKSIRVWPYNKIICSISPYTHKHQAKLIALITGTHTHRWHLYKLMCYKVPMNWTDFHTASCE